MYYYRMLNINNKIRKVIIAMVSVSIVLTVCKLVKNTSCSTCENKN